MVWHKNHLIEPYCWKHLGYLIPARQSHFTGLIMRNRVTTDSAKDMSLVVCADCDNIASC